MVAVVAVATVAIVESTMQQRRIVVASVRVVSPVVLDDSAIVDSAIVDSVVVAENMDQKIEFVVAFVVAIERAVDRLSVVAALDRATIERVVAIGFVVVVVVAAAGAEVVIVVRMPAVDEYDAMAQCEVRNAMIDWRVVLLVRAMTMRLRHQRV